MSDSPLQRRSTGISMINEMIEQAAAFEKSGQLDLAKGIYNVALDLLPEADKTTRARILLLRGRLNYRLKNSQGALADLQTAFQLDPTLADVLTGEFSKFYKESCH